MTLYMAENLRAHLEGHRSSTATCSGQNVSSESIQATIDRLFSNWPPGIKDADLAEHTEEAVKVAHAIRRHFPLMDFRCEPPDIKSMALIHLPVRVNWSTDLVYFDLPRVLAQGYSDRPMSTPARALGMASFSKDIRALALNVELGVGGQMEADVTLALDSLRPLTALRDIFLVVRPARVLEVDWQPTMLACLRALADKDGGFFTTLSLDQFQRAYEWPNWNRRGRGSWNPAVWGMPAGNESPSDEGLRIAREKFADLLLCTANTFFRERRSAKIHWVFQNGQLRECLPKIR